MRCTNYTLAGITVLGLLAVGCNHKNSGISSELVVRSNDLTASAVADVLAGSSDFTLIQGKLAEALAANPGNRDARLFLGVVGVLDTAQQELRQDGQLNQLLARAGVLCTNPSGSLWDMQLALENHGQGLFKDTTPRLGEIQGYIHAKVRPALDGLVAVLEALPADYEYVIPAARGGRLLQWLVPGQVQDLRLDRGDLQMAASMAHSILAVFDLLGTVEWDDLAPNDFDFVENPNLDVLALIRTTYVNLGHLANPGDLLRARDQIRAAWQCYANASAHLRAEDPVRQQQGMMTLGRETFGNAQQTQAFLAKEAAVKAQLGSVVDACYVDRAVRFDTDLFTGNPLPVADQMEINFFRFFLGLDLRDTYFKTVVEPFDGQRRLGVARWTDLTATMANFQGVLVSIGGVAPSAGDLQELMYTVRVDDPPVGQKQIDGDFSDWQTAAMLVLGRPAAWLQHPAPDLGSVQVAVDSNYLYAYLDRDLTQFLTATGDRYELTITGPNGHGAVIFEAGVGHWASTSMAEPPAYYHNPQGLEVRFPIGVAGTGNWVRLERQFRANNSSYVVDSDPEPVYVRVH